MEQQLSQPMQNAKENETLPKGFISGSTLKIIAIVTMLIDHIGAALLETRLQSNPDSFLLSLADIIMRMIGRIAFPIFCFLLVEGFLHTKDVKKYALRLLLFCFISEIPFNLAFYGTCFYFGYQNVYFTLLLGLLALIGIDHFKGNQLLQFSCVIFAMVAALFLKTDYSYFGVFAIVILYLCRNQRPLQCIVGAISFFWELTASLSFIPILFYNGKRGLSLKYFFYVFYPAHLLILGLIRVFLL